MINTMSCSRHTGASMNFSLCCRKPSFAPQSNIRTVPLSYSQDRIPECTLSQLKLLEADIGGMTKLEHSIKQTIHIFQKRGFTDLEITKIMRARQVMGCPKEILESKLQALEDFGFVDQNLRKLLLRSDFPLVIDLKNNLIPKLEFLKDEVESNDVLVKILLKNPRIIGRSLEKTLKPSLAFWKGWGFSGTELVRFLKIDPFVLSRTSLSPAEVDLINKMSRHKKSRGYLYIVSEVAVSNVEMIKEKIENFELCGLSAEETWQVLGSNPCVLSFSKENIREKIDFVVTKMELPANYVVKHSTLLLASLERRIKPRFLVWQKIKAIDGTQIPFSTVFSMAETQYVRLIIETHPDCELLWTIYVNAREAAKK